MRLLECHYNCLFLKGWGELIHGCPFRQYSTKVILRISLNFFCNLEFCILGSSSVTFINFYFPRKTSLLERGIHIYCHTTAFLYLETPCICGYIIFLLIIPCASSLVLYSRSELAAFRLIYCSFKVLSSINFPSYLF